VDGSGPEDREDKDALLARYCRLATRDLDEAREYVGRMWERHQSTLRRGRSYRLHWHHAELTHSRLSFIRSPSAIAVSCGPVSTVYRVTLHLAGALKHRINGQPASSTPVGGVLHCPGDVLEIETEPFQALLLTLDGAFVDAGLRSNDDGSLLKPPLPREFSLTTPAGAALKAMCVWVAHELDREDAAARTFQEQRMASVEDTLRTLLINCLAEQQPAAAPRSDAVTEARLRRIEEWIDAHYADPIGLMDLARAGGIGVRSVQLAFQRLRGHSPMESVLQRRLRHARQRLGSGELGLSVTKVATDCGFYNLGRFSVRYRQMFGESPSQTLLRNCGAIGSPHLVCSEGANR
jgi:AraC-like DNA-binding protein